MKIIMPKLFFVLTMMLIIFSQHGAMAKSVEMQVHIGLYDISKLGYSDQEIKQSFSDEGMIANSPIWRVKNCCNQKKSAKGLKSKYCFSEDIRRHYPNCAVL